MLDSIDTLVGFALIFTVVSLLITIVVQVVTSLTNLRGKNLAWGVAEAFEAIAPELKAEVGQKGKNLADQVLKDPLLSDSQVGSLVAKAKAVRAEELFSLLHSIAINKRAADQQTKENIKVLFKGLGVPTCVLQVTKDDEKTLQDRQTEINKILATLGDGPAKERLQAELEKIGVWLKNSSDAAENVAIRWTAQGEAEIQRMYQQFEHWFEIGQERSQEWFTTHARIITAVLGIMAAFSLQLDTIEIYKLVSSNRAVRDSLVAQTKTVIDQGEKLLKDGRPVLQKALMTVSASNSFLTNVAIASDDNFEGAKARIRAACAGRSQEQIANVLDSFDQQVANVAKTNLSEYTGDYNVVAKSLDKTGFDLFPKGGWRWALRDDNGKILEYNWSDHLLGMLFSALLLSLGAPFWFNTLKSLASMRSSVAENISGEEKAEQKSGKADESHKAPVTVK